MAKLHDSICKQQNKHPESFFIVAGDFNHSCLKAVLPKFYKNVDIKTRKNKTLDQVYTNVPGAYKTYRSPHLGQSDHLSLFLTPAYKPLISRKKTQIKTVQIWTEEVSSALQDCFEDTKWELFDQSDLELYTSTVLSYINFCTDIVTLEKQIKVYPNQKPWFNNRVRELLRVRDAALRSRDREEYGRARANLHRGITQAKREYKQRIEDNFNKNNPHAMWQGVRNITDYKQSNSHPTSTDPSLPDQLNTFFTRFEDSSM